MTKKALLMGFSYPNVEPTHHLPINPLLAIKMKEALVEFLGFEEKNIILRVDSYPFEDNAEAQNNTSIEIERILKDFVQQLIPEDILFIYMTGHGSSRKIEVKQVFKDYNQCCKLRTSFKGNTTVFRKLHVKFSETLAKVFPWKGYNVVEENYDSHLRISNASFIAPDDSKPVSSDVFHSLCVLLPKGVELVFAIESCHSGGLLKMANIMPLKSPWLERHFFMDVFYEYNIERPNLELEDKQILFFASSRFHESSHTFCASTLEEVNEEPVLGHIVANFTVALHHLIQTMEPGGITNFDLFTFLSSYLNKQKNFGNISQQPELLYTKHPGDTLFLGGTPKEKGEQHTKVKSQGFAAACSLVDSDSSPVLVSRSGDSRRNVIGWIDHRAIDQAKRINTSNSPVLEYCGGAVSPEMQPPKLLWVKENLQESWSTVFRWMDLSDWLPYRATGDDTRSLCTMQHINDKVSRDMEACGCDDEFWEEIGSGDIVEGHHAKIVIQMSVVTDSPVHSSGSDDFIDHLNEALDASSPNSSSDEEAENQDEFEDLSRNKRRKFESTEETEGSTLEGIVEQKLVVAESSVVKVDGCTHPGSFVDMCICCGHKLDGESGVTFGYIHKGLRPHDEEISRLRNTEMKKFLYSKKLFLVLDLDHTLLNTTILGQLSSEESHLLNETDSLEDVSKGSLFKSEHMHMMTKLRPFVRTFLKEASAMFDMYIYTMGDRPYALEMAKLLDPQGEYFNAKVISRDDGTQKHQKGLDIVLGQESAVLILDDTEHAWMKHKNNLILMERYHFFASSCRQFGFNGKSLAETKSDENETDGALAKILEVLKQVHCMFFEKLQGDLVDRDVRQVLSSVRGEILSGCVIIFSRINHLALPTLKRIAEQMGATCLTELDPTVTHVVATDAGTEKTRWAVKEKKCLIHPHWVEAANYFWQKQPEENFVIKKDHYSLVV